MSESPIPKGQRMDMQHIIIDLIFLFSVNPIFIFSIQQYSHCWKELRIFDRPSFCGSSYFEVSLGKWFR